jgi:hypothetical protein
MIEIAEKRKDMTEAQMVSKDRKVNIYPTDGIAAWMRDNLRRWTRKPTDQWERSAYALKYLVETYGEDATTDLLAEMQTKTEREWSEKSVPWVQRILKIQQ